MPAAEATRRLVPSSLETARRLRYTRVKPHIETYMTPLLTNLGRQTNLGLTAHIPQV